ncbi:MAG TPA: ParA family protein [Planctomycetota bacterium]|nr:ParA family protein [Planctomycetota bacterium]
MPNGTRRVRIRVHSIVLANQKGGVGKTTTAIHLAHGLALAGRRVLLIDLDPQGNATVAVQGMVGGNAGDGLLGEMTPVAERLWLLPSPGAAAVMERRASVDLDKLRGLVAAIEDLVDWLVVDCPPRMDDWGWAGVQLCDQVVVPVQAEFFAMHGLSQMLSSLRSAAAEFPGKAVLRGVLPTMVDAREPVSGEILEDLRANLGELVLGSVVFRDVSVVEAASHGTSVFVHCPWSKSALCYAELVKELIDG